MSRSNASVRDGLGQNEADWPKLWVPPFFKHLCVYDSNKKKRGRKWRGGSREKIEGREKGSRWLTNHTMGCRRALRNAGASKVPVSFGFPSHNPQMAPKDGWQQIPQQRLGSLPLGSGDTVAPLAVDCSG